MADTDQPGPLDLDPVFACPGCGCLVVDQQLHNGVCGRRDDVTSPPPLGPQIVEWLDTLNPDELEQQALAECGFDTSGTVAILDRLKKLAAGL
jgi:hypothetical protein